MNIILYVSDLQTLTFHIIRSHNFSKGSNNNKKAAAITKKVLRLCLFYVAVVCMLESVSERVYFIIFFPRVCALLSVDIRKKISAGAYISS